MIGGDGGVKKYSFFEEVESFYFILNRVREGDSYREFKYVVLRKGSLELVSFFTVYFGDEL